MHATVRLIEMEIPRLRRYARFLAGDIDYADDLVQECLTRAIAKVDSWQPGTNLRAWLFVILRNCYFNDLRRKKCSPFIDVADGAAPNGQISASQYVSVTLNEVRAAFAELSEEHREVLLLVAVEGVSYEEAAEIIGVPIGTVRSRTSRARHRLRRALDGKDEPGQKDPAGLQSAYS